DLITDIPDYNLNKSWAEETVRLLPDILPRCSAIIASADLLAEAFRSYNQFIYVLPNLIDEKVWKTSPKKALNTPIVIGFAGTATHRADLEVVEPALFRIAQKYGDRVAFRFMGEAYQELTTLPGFSFIPFERGYNSYARTLGEAGFDIALVPLKDNLFNRCKSNIKWLEYSICGVAGIYSDLPPYNSCIRHGATGVLVDNDPDKWYQALSLLIEHPEMRHEIARNSHAVVSNHYTIRAKAHKYIDTYREIMVAHQNNLLNLKNVNQVKVSIIIPLFNNMSYTRQCLEQLRQNTNAELYELILVDNGCTDNTYTLFGALPANVKVIRNLKNQGFAKACNQGAEAANGKYLLFLNNDTEPQPGWLEPLLSTAELDSGIAAVGSKLLFPDGTIQHAGVVIAEDHVTPDLLVGKHIYYGFPTDHPAANISRVYQALTAACLLVRRDAFEDVHGFDEGYWNGYEDVDLCFKLGQKGWKLIYQPASILIHHESKSGIERFTRVASNIERLHQKWLGLINPDLIIHADSREEWLYGVASVATLPAPLVSIVIPLFNQAQLTKACIEAIRATAGDPGRYELLLVDNGSWDWTPEYLKTLGNTVTVITNSDNVGFAKACNQAAKLAKAKYLLFLNNDTVPQAGWLDAMLAGMNKYGADIVGAKLLYPNGKVQHAGVSFNRNGIGYHIFKNFAADAPAVNKKRFMQCVTAACMLVSKQLFNELDGFDERFQNGFEDVDFCLRAGRVGKRVLYTPDAVVIHIEEQSEGRKQHDHQNMQLYLTRWHGLVDCDDEKFYAAEGFTVEWHADGT
ncbi:MAG: glycosyltransferase, partial [Deltaproteobacteria bacterium]